MSAHCDGCGSTDGMSWDQKWCAKCDPARAGRPVFYVWVDDHKGGFYTHLYDDLAVTIWTRYRQQAFAFKTRLVAQAVAERYPGSMVLCCFAPGAAPDEQRGYEPKVREHEGEER